MQINNDELACSHTETFNCLICMDIRPMNDIFLPYISTNNTTTCFHPFCMDCIAKHVDSKVQQNIPTIQCPDVGCMKEIDFDSCIGIIPKLVLDRWEAILSKSLILSSTSLYCPFKDCSAELLKAKEEVIRALTLLQRCASVFTCIFCCASRPYRPCPSTCSTAECPHCRRYICKKCNDTWHDGLTCEKFVKFGDDWKANEEVMLRNLANEKNWVRCPNCKFYVERTSGC